MSYRFREAFIKSVSLSETERCILINLMVWSRAIYLNKTHMHYKRYSVL
jgi:hypothetical protein